MPPKKGGTKASGGLTLARGIGPQDIKLLNKLGLDEKEAMLVRFLGRAGEPEVRLLDLAELHLPDSKDAKSLDAQCITAAFKRDLDLFDDRRGKWLHGGSWRYSLVNSSSQRARQDLPHASSHPCGPRYAGQGDVHQRTLHAGGEDVPIPRN
jgi:hypothetical protein